MDLDKAYSEADKFDQEQWLKWFQDKYEILCKRTERPKLGYIIHRLNEAGIASVIYGSSFHAEECLYVEKSKIEEAWKILESTFNPEAPNGYVSTLDDMRDDDGVFYEYENTQPDPELWGVEDDVRKAALNHRGEP